MLIFIIISNVLNIYCILKSNLFTVLLELNTFLTHPSLYVFGF